MLSFIIAVLFNLLLFFRQPQHHQGALGIEGRQNDEKMDKILESVICKHTTLRCLAERAFLRTFVGGRGKGEGEKRGKMC